MKSWQMRLLAAALIAGAAQVLVGCTPKGERAPIGVAPGGGQSGPIAPGPAAPGSPVAGAPSRHSSGGSDSGGCNGIGNKCYDSYIVDPLKLQAFQQRLKGILANIEYRRSKEQSASQSGYETAFQLKSWYLAPVEFDQIDKDSLGVEFVKDETQQIARQSMTSVWINKTLFDKMSIDDQAELLLHEMVMTLYMLRFMKVSEICEFSALSSASNAASCRLYGTSLDKAMPPEPRRKLTEKDNENIRAVTAWILHNTRDPQKPIKAQEFSRFLRYRGFDKRFYRDEDNDSKDQKPKGLKVSGKEIYNAFQAAASAHDLPEICSQIDGPAKQKCEVTLTETEIPFQQIKLPGLKLQVSLADGAKIEMNLTQDTETTLNENQTEEGSFYSLPLMDMRASFRIGDTVYSGFAFFKTVGDPRYSGLVLHSLIIRPSVIAAIDKTKEIVCRLRPVNPRTFLENKLHIHKDGVEMNSAERLYDVATTFAACTKENVAP